MLNFKLYVIVSSAASSYVSYTYMNYAYDTALDEIYFSLYKQNVYILSTYFCCISRNMNITAHEIVDNTFDKTVCTHADNAVGTTVIL